VATYAAPLSQLPVSIWILPTLLIKFRITYDILLRNLLLGQKVRVLLEGRRHERILRPELGREVPVRVAQGGKHGLDGVTHGTRVT